MCDYVHDWVLGIKSMQQQLYYAPYSRLRTLCVGLARTMYIRLIYGIFGREITKFTVIYGVYIQFWPTLLMCNYSTRAVCDHVHDWVLGI